MIDPPRVLVTGCSSGFGALTARALVKAGYSVVAGVRDSAGRNAGAAAALRSAAEGPGALDIVDLDVTRDASVEAAVAAAGEVDVLVNNAGIAGAGLIETFSIAQAEALFAVNVFGALRMVRAVLPGMKRRGRGLIVHVTSELARTVLPGLGIYCASKAALDSLAESLHYELAATGIESVSIEPATYPTTGIVGNLQAPAEPARADGYGPVAELPRQLGEGLAQMVAQGFAPDPAEVAAAIVALIQAPKRPLRTLLPSPDSAHIAAINAAAATAQAAAFQRTGMTSLLRDG
jgi:NAD(P)-dependent dehydrogenase (short-subunit alcohol dehydrogenase family)